MAGSDPSFGGFSELVAISRYPRPFGARPAMAADHLSDDGAYGTWSPVA